MPSIVCQRCHEINEPTATTCQKCGARFCPSCHLVIESPSASICPHCGKKDLSFRPGKFGVASYPSGDSSVGYAAGKIVCPTCGNKIDPGLKKCPYCGQLGSRFTITPPEEQEALHPASDEPYYSYTQPAESGTVPSQQRICPKCGMPFPPGASQCPKHGKYGGTGILSESGTPLPGRYTGDLWRRIEEKRSAGMSAEQGGTITHHTPPQEIYPQMAAEQEAQQEAYTPEEVAPRICPSCGSAVPDRSKVCPVCGWNRLPPQKSKPIIRAEEFYKAQQAGAGTQPYPSYVPQADAYYGQPGSMQPYDMQPYEMMYPAQPSPMEAPPKTRKRKKERLPGESKFERQEARPRTAGKSVLPLLLALVIVAIAIYFAASYILGELNKPAAVVVPPTTTSTTTKAPVISDVEYKDIGTDSATIVWKTDKKSNSKVTYCIDEPGGQCRYANDPNMVTDHSIKLTGLEPSKSYHITVTSRLDDDPASPYATQEVEQPLRLQGVADTTPPKISDVKPVNLTDSAVTITWNTDEPATSQVAYGTSAGYGSLQPPQADTTLTKVHDVMLQGLPSNSTFHFKVISRDASGNESSSPDATFKTSPPVGSSIGSQAPDFELNCANQDEPFKLSSMLSSMQGSKLILNFWSLGCDPCVKEMPFLQLFHEQNPNVPVIAVAGPQVGQVNGPAIGSVISNNNYTFIVPLDTYGEVGARYNIQYVPTTFLIDSTGKILKKQEGSFTNLSGIQSWFDSP